MLKNLQDGRIGVDEVVRRLHHLPYEDLGFAKVDHLRQLRRGFPEVIFCPGKTVEQITAIVDRLTAAGGTVLATRAEEDTFEAVKKIHPQAEYSRTARVLIIRGAEELKQKGLVVVISAGTADLPVAEEAALTADLMGSRVERLYDVGVAGIHRLFDGWEIISQARSIVVAAGMEGALASVVGGLVACPVIAVPTSVGYGANFKGLAPLLAMLNSCASGVAVVNIDNGYGAGYTAALINRIGDDDSR